MFCVQPKKNARSPDQSSLHHRDVMHSCHCRAGFGALSGTRTNKNIANLQNTHGNRLQLHLQVLQKVFYVAATKPCKAFNGFHLFLWHLKRLCVYCVYNIRKDHMYVSNLVVAQCHKHETRDHLSVVCPSVLRNYQSLSFN